MRRRNVVETGFSIGVGLGLLAVVMAGCSSTGVATTAGSDITTVASTSSSVSVGSSPVGEKPGNSSSLICNKIRSLATATDAEKTPLIRDIAAQPEASKFADLLKMTANLRDSSRGLTVGSADQSSLSLRDPAVQTQTEAFRQFARDNCGISAEVLK